MTFPKPVTLTIYMVLAAAIVGGSLWLDTRSRNDARLAEAHLTYGRSCGGCIAVQPPIQADLFGDGTLILQSAFDSGGESYVAHVDPDAVKAYFNDLDADAYWQEAPLRSPPIDGPFCYVSFKIDGLARDAGCEIEVAEAPGRPASMQDHPQVVRLERLMDLKRFNDFDPAHPSSAIALYRPSPRYRIDPLPRMPAPPPPAR